MHVGEKIKQRRLELGLTQEELAKKCGYKSRSSINKIELSRDLPLAKLGRMAAVLNCTPNELLGFETSLTEENANFSVEMLNNPAFMQYAKKLFYADEKTQQQVYSYIDFLLSQ